MEDEESGGHILLNEENENDSFDLANENIKPAVNLKDIWYQIVASNIGYLFSLHSGINLAFSNLLFNEFDERVTSWFTSLVSLSTPIGSCLGGPLMDKIGRKGANLAVALPCLLSWGLTFGASSDKVVLLYVARFFAGIAGGLTISNVVYVSEISHEKYRPMFLSLLGVYFSLGILLTTIVHTFLTWKQTALFNFVLFTVAFILVAFFTPESPIWLASFRSDWVKAKQSLRVLYANEKVFEAEWAKLGQSIRSNKKTVEENVKLSSAAVYKPLGILIGLFFLQQSSCIYLVIMYALKLFPMISPRVSKHVVNEAFILFGILRFVSSIFGSVLSFKFGRKTLLMSSSAGMSLSCAILLVTVYMQDSISSFGLVYEWISLIMLCLFVFFGTYGVMGIPWTLIVELLPNKMRSIGSAAIVSYGYMLMFLFAKIFPFVFDYVNKCLVFAFITLSSAAFYLFVYLWVPETFGKSLNEIENYFLGQR